MNGETWKAGKFAYSLRRSLWSEHLGLSAGEVSNSKVDPHEQFDYEHPCLYKASHKRGSFRHDFKLNLTGIVS